MIDCIVQCKLRSNTLTLSECATFFASQNVFDDVENKTIVRWSKLIIARNSDSILTKHLAEKYRLFIDLKLNRDELLIYCQNLYDNSLKSNSSDNSLIKSSDNSLKSNSLIKSSDNSLKSNSLIKSSDNSLIKSSDNSLIKSSDNSLENNSLESNSSFILRDYQIDCVNLIKNTINSNLIINLPTGCGKNIIMIYSFELNKRYLILVPRIILTEQFKNELIKHKPNYPFEKLKVFQEGAPRTKGSAWGKSNIQIIGDGSNIYNQDKLITICVYNSVKLIKDYIHTFDKIFIDEAHHISKPEIYMIDDDNNDSDNIIDSDNDNDFDNENNSDNENDLNNNKDMLDETSEDKQNYIKIINQMTKYSNNIYLSATIDKIDGFVYKHYDIRQMIELKYLSDYTIHIPIFLNNKTDNNKIDDNNIDEIDKVAKSKKSKKTKIINTNSDINICKYLLERYSNMIIYCNSHVEGQKIVKLFNQLQLNSAKYIDCLTSPKIRNQIINDYKLGNIQFLVNVRILVEGFDAPITQGVVFMHLPSSKTTIIQIIGRALRLYENKKYANIILPYETEEDQKSISKFLNILARHDNRIKQTFKNKSIGGYINIENVVTEELTEDQQTEFQFKYEMVYDNMGELLNGQEIWMNKLEEVKKYIDEHKQRPTKENKNKEIQRLGYYLHNQIKSYKNKTNIMKNEIIYNKWTTFINDEKYKQYFLDNITKWMNMLDNVSKYINENNKRPPTHSDNNYVKQMAQWISDCQKHYKNKEYIMKDSNIKQLWKNFIENYQYYFIDNNTKWIDILNKVKNYINEHKKTPFMHHKNKDISKFGRWLSCQKQSYQKKIQIMKDNDIRQLWENFIQEYYEYFLDNNMIWINTLDKLKTYINHNNNIPNKRDKNKDIKHLGIWLLHQKQSYRLQKDRIMKDDNIRKLFVDFITDPLYKIYFENIEIHQIDKLKTLDFDIDKLIYDFNKNLSNHYKFLNKIKIKYLNCIIYIFINI